MIAIITVVTIIMLISLAFTVFYRQVQNNIFDEVANTIRSASKAFLLWQNIAILALIIPSTLAMWYFDLQKKGFLFLAGAISILISGSYHMLSSTYGNIITANTILEGIEPAFLKAVQVSAAGTTLLYSTFTLIILLLTKYLSIQSIHFYILGVCLASLMIRWCGGTFTKSADIGADLLGKIRMDLNEDDMKNPLVISDSVGDNVGDQLIASIGSIENWIIGLSVALHYIRSTKVVGGIAITAIISPVVLLLIFKYFLHADSIMSSILIYLLSNAIIITAITAITGFMSGASAIIFIAGLLTMIGICAVAYRFTGSKSAEKVVSLTEHGPAMNIIGGLAQGYQGVGLLMFVLSTPILLILYYGFNVNNLACFTLGAISISPSLLILDNTGPIFDNAAGMIEMKAADYRHNADVLDNIGNTTKAITKVYGAVASIVCLINILQLNMIGCVSYEFVFIVIGTVAFVCTIAAASLSSVGKTAFRIVNFVNNKILTSEEITLNDHMTVVEELTKNSILTMFRPLAICLLLPVVLYILMRFVFNANIHGFIFTMHVVMMIVCSVIGLSMIVSGSLWDNVKKSIELAGYKKKPIYKDAVIGDMVGDPFKDTAGPILISLPKMMIFLLMCLSHLVSLRSIIL